MIVLKTIRFIIGVIIWSFALIPAIFCISLVYVCEEEKKWNYWNTLAETLIYGFIILTRED